MPYHPPRAGPPGPALGAFAAPKSAAHTPQTCLAARTHVRRLDGSQAARSPPRTRHSPATAPSSRRAHTDQGDDMTHYLLEVGYTPASWSGQIEREANVVERITPALDTCGASIVSIHYTFGDHDLVAICDFPSPEDAAAFGLAVTSTGALRSYRTTPLLSVEQGIESMRRAAELKKVYTPPSAGTAGGSGAGAPLLRTGYAAFAVGDLDTVLGMFDPSIIWHTPESISFGGTYVGPAAVGDFFGKLVENYSELHVEPDQYL